MALELNSCLVCCSLSSISRRTKAKLSSRLVRLHKRPLNTESFEYIKDAKSFKFIHGKATLTNILSKRKFIPFSTSVDEGSFNELETDDFGPEKEDPLAINSTSENIPFRHPARGKPGLISFYGPGTKIEKRAPVSSPVKNRNGLVWLVGPTVLVASFVFPSLYLRKILSSIFEDSLLTDFLILFFTEALFYCGVALFLILIDRLNRPKETKHAATVAHAGQRASYVAVLVLSVIIPTVTMGFVWPWTGPAASATLAPYLVGIVVQFAFEAKYVDSPSRLAIPVVFQVYRLHQLNRATQLVTALSFTVRGAETTPHSVAVNGSLSTLLNALQFLGIISIWSLSSFVVRYLPCADTEC